MADGWYYGGIRVFAQEEVVEKTQITARLNPLGGGTVVHVFGNDDPIKQINGIVVGSGDMESIRAFTDTGAAYPLSSYVGSEGMWLLSRVQSTRKQIYRQTLRTDLPDDSPVYTVTLELYEE
jgi:hypothetical protein